MKQSLKKNIILLILIFIVFSNVYSQDYYVFDQFWPRVLGDIGYRFMFPLDNKPWHLSFLNVGLGVGIDLLEYVLSPGLYVDLGIGTDWLYVFSDSYDSDSNYSPVQFFVSGGIRIYNYMRILRFDVIPFFGYNFMLFFLPLPNAGVSISFGDFPLGIEYAYYFPSRYLPYGRMHHIMIKFTLVVGGNED